MASVPSVDALAAELEREAADPAARLRAAIATGRELDEAGDALVERFVAGARAAGLSWTQIGELFGTSKQAAQKRYGGAPASGAWPGPAGASLRPLLDHAADAARELGARCVGTEHVLLALTAGGGGAAEALAELGVTRAGVLAALGPDAAPAGDGALGVMPRLKRALERARTLAAGGPARPEHLLAAIVADRDAYAVCILEQLGVRPRAVRAALARRLGVAEAQLAPRRRRRFRRAAA